MTAVDASPERRAADAIDRAAFEAAVLAKSPLSPSQIDRLFGGTVTEGNKAVVWRFINMTHAQQNCLWEVFLRVKHAAPDAQVEAVR